MDEPVFRLDEYPLHLGRGATAEVLPAFTGEMAWYEAYGAAHAADGEEGRLVSMHTFDTSWDQWEVHPHGHEVVLCLSGTITLHQEFPDGSTAAVVLEAGEATVNPPGVWHTADVEGPPVRALFITAGLGTEGRRR